MRVCLCVQQSTHSIWMNFFFISHLNQTEKENEIQMTKKSKSNCIMRSYTIYIYIYIVVYFVASYWHCQYIDLLLQTVDNNTVKRSDFYTFSHCIHFKRMVIISFFLSDIE